MIQCVVCGEDTDYLCAWCRVYDRKNVPLCGRIDCREKHELTEMGCVRTRKPTASEPEGGER